MFLPRSMGPASFRMSHVVTGDLQRLQLSGSLSIRNSDFWAGFRPNFGQTWPQSPSRTTGLVLQCRLHQKSAQRTNSKANSRSAGRSTGRSLKVDPIGTGRPQSTSRGQGGRPGIYFKAGSATTEGPGPDPQSTFTPNLLSLGIYFQRPAGTFA